MSSSLGGIHHITAIASDPQKNVDFYAGLLGLRLVKKTVNFDDPSAYHLYFGDEAGTPGSIVAFFYWPGGTGRGRVGSGQSTRLSFSAAPAALDFWRERLQRHGVTVALENRFGETALTFVDPDGIPVEVVADAADARDKANLCGRHSRCFPRRNRLAGTTTRGLEHTAYGSRLGLNAIDTRSPIKESGSAAVVPNRHQRADRYYWEFIPMKEL